MFLDLLFPNRHRIKRIMDQQAAQSVALADIQASVNSMAKTAAASNAKVDLLLTAFAAQGAQLSALAAAGGATPEQLNDLKTSIDATVATLATEADKVTAALASASTVAVGSATAASNPLPQPDVGALSPGTSAGGDTTPTAGAAVATGSSDQAA
jgi:hypothetical protein